jgi:hypothetical protein
MSVTCLDQMRVCNCGILMLCNSFWFSSMFFLVIFLFLSAYINTALFAVVLICFLPWSQIFVYVVLGLLQRLYEISTSFCSTVNFKFSGLMKRRRCMNNK